MPRAAVDTNQRLAMRIRAEDKRVIIRAAALRNMELSHFVLQSALSAAEAEIERAEQLHLIARDSLRVLEALENPPAPTARMVAAVRALPADV